MAVSFGELLRLACSRDPRDRLRFRQEAKSQPGLGWIWHKAERLWARLTQRDASGYLAMQKRSYELFASADQVVPGEIRGDYVAGSWQEHDVWPDYEAYLMKYVPKGSEGLALNTAVGRVAIFAAGASGSGASMAWISPRKISRTRALS